MRSQRTLSLTLEIWRCYWGVGNENKNHSLLEVKGLQPSDAQKREHEKCTGNSCMKQKSGGKENLTRIIEMWGTSVAQLVKHFTLDFGSGHDLTVREFKPCMGHAAVSTEPTLDPLYPFLTARPPLALLQN